MHWSQHKRLALVYAIAIVGWALFLGPQLQQQVEPTKRLFMQQWQHWQADNTPACLKSRLHNSNRLIRTPRHAYRELCVGGRTEVLA